MTRNRQPSAHPCTVLRPFASLLLALLLLAGAQAQTQPDPATLTFRLNKVEVNGLQKITREKFIEVSGLQLGQSLKFADLRPATDKLYASGLFARVSYRYSWTEENLDVTFTVEEAAPAAPASTPAPARPAVLGKIEFTGLQRFDQATAARATGLQLGAPLDQKALSTAAKQLAQTGYFTDINYSYKVNAADQMVALFEVTEFKWDVPCIFDNFVWFVPGEVAAAVRAQIPAFNGFAPDNEFVPNAIKAALEQMLQSRGIARGVNFVVSFGDLEGPNAGVKKEFVFAATGAPLPVCQIAFPGASPALEKQLQSVTKPLVATNYSAQQFEQFAQESLLAVYRQRGYLRAKFTGVQPQLETANKKCPGGVNVALPVEEGTVYKLGKFEWTGNQALAQATMQDLFGMKSGATADGFKIDKGLNAVKTAYLNQGYLDLKLQVDTDFDESTRTANYRIAVIEGASYKMGEVVIANASEKETARLRGKWPLAPGAAFNFGAVREFVKKLSEDRSARMPRVQVRTDKAKQTANVVFTY